MSVYITHILAAAPFLALIALGVVWVWWAGRDRKPDTYTVDDYRPLEVDITGDARAFTAGVERARRRPRPVPLDILPPAPPGTVVGLPLYAEMVVADLMRRRFGTTNPGAVAGGMLREIARSEQCKTADRDMTGAFPVVAVA